MAGEVEKILRDLLDELDAASVECDGMSRLVVTRLHRAGIEHIAFDGMLTVQGRVISRHFWVEVGDLVIDYRARMWLGDDPEVPHGVFRKDAVLGEYRGQPTDMIRPVPAWMESVLMMQLPSEMDAALRRHANGGK